LRRRLPLEAITLITVHAKMLRLELLKVKADLERELEDFSLNCSRCASTFIGSAVSASRPDIGRTGSPRRTASRQFDNHKWIA
jgi:hypothetical protein